MNYKKKYEKYKKKYLIAKLSGGYTEHPDNDNYVNPLTTSDYSDGYFDGSQGATTAKWMAGYFYPNYMLGYNAAELKKAEKDEKNATRDFAKSMYKSGEIGYTMG
jgi:hypothetical protein